MKTLVVTHIPTDKTMFCVGELRVMQFKRRGLTPNWTPRETLNEFYETTIQLTVENLIMHNIFTCSTALTTTTTLFFFSSLETTDYLTCDEAKISGKRLGYLEKRIIEQILQHPGYTMSDHIYQLFTNLIGQKKYRNPGHQIFNKIIRENAFEFWTYTSKKIWLQGEKIEMTIDETREAQMVDELNSIVRPIIEERNKNQTFRLFSQRLYHEIEEQLNLKEED